MRTVEAVRDEDDSSDEQETSTTKGRKKRAYFTKQLKQEVIAYATDHGITETAAKYKIDEYNVRNWLKRANDPAPAKSKPPAKGPRPTSPRPQGKPGEKTAAAWLRSIGLDPEQWSIVHSSGMKLQ